MKESRTKLLSGAILVSDRLMTRRQECSPRLHEPGSALTVGYNYGLPLSHLLLARQLEGLTTLRKRSVLYDDRLKKTRLTIDWSMAVALPIIGILLHLTQQVRRFLSASLFEHANCDDVAGTTLLYHGGSRMYPCHVLERVGRARHGFYSHRHRRRRHDLHR